MYTPSQALRSFLAKPSRQATYAVPKDRGTRWRTFAFVLVVDLALTFVAILLISGLEAAGLVDNSNHRVTESLNALGPWWVIIIFAGLIIPFFEEVTFRLYLRPVARNTWISTILLLFYLSMALMGGLRGANALTVALVLVLGSLGVLIVVFWLKRLGVWPEITGRYFHWLFWFSVVLFGVAHLLNFESLSLQQLLFAPILILGQLIVGALCGFLRVRMGFVWAVALHAAHNTLLIGLALLGQNGEFGQGIFCVF